MALALLAALALSACGPSATVTPTAEPAPAPTEASASAATALPGDGDVKEAVQRLFDTWNQALREDDAELFRSTLTRELAGQCDTATLQSWLDQEEPFFAEAEVVSVFVDLDDASRAFAEIRTVGRTEMGESPTFPWPVMLEDGEWRAGFYAGLPTERCPYEASRPSAGPDGGEREFPQIPGLDLGRRENALDAVPGTSVLHVSYLTDRFGSGFSSRRSAAASGDQVNIYAELETDAEGAELVRLYRDGLMHPSWEILDEGSSGDFGWFSWTVRDGEGTLWRGKLVVAPSQEGWKHVWLSVHSSDSEDNP